MTSHMSYSFDIKKQKQTFQMTHQGHREQSPFALFPALDAEKLTFLHNSIFRSFVHQKPLGVITYISVHHQQRNLDTFSPGILLMCIRITRMVY